MDAAQDYACQHGKGCQEKKAGEKWRVAASFHAAFAQDNRIGLSIGMPYLLAEKLFQRFRFTEMY